MDKLLRYTGMRHPCFGIIAYVVIYLIYFTAQTEGDIAYDYDDAYDDEFDDDEVLGVEPIFDVPLLNVTVVAGQTALLPCSITHLGKHKVAWTDPSLTSLTYEDRRVVDDSRFSIVRSYLREWNLQIRDVGWKDQGGYLCTINTQPVKSKTVMLHVKVPPRILDELSTGDQTVQEGETVVLICNVTGFPKPSVTWYRTPIRNSGGASHESKACQAHANGPGIGLQGEMIIISNVTRYCDDVYECRVSNGVLPDVSRHIRVTVEFPPEVYIRTALIRQALGRETILECKITAFPQAINYWTRNGEKVTSSFRFHIQMFDDEDPSTISLNLHIIDIKEDDYGEYTCIAQNQHGRDVGKMVLREMVQQKPNPRASTLPTIIFDIPSRTHQPKTEKPRGHGNYVNTDNQKSDTADAQMVGSFSGCTKSSPQVTLLLILGIFWMLFRRQ